MSSLVGDAGWPYQRLRLAFGALLFVAFELFVGKQLPPVVTVMIFVLGAVCMISAQMAIKDWKSKVQLDLIKQAFDSRPARS